LLLVRLPAFPLHFNEDGAAALDRQNVRHALARVLAEFAELLGAGPADKERWNLLSRTKKMRLAAR
jgi:hypothetical protein